MWEGLGQAACPCFRVGVTETACPVCMYTPIYIHTSQIHHSARPHTHRAFNAAHSPSVLPPACVSRRKLVK